MELLLGSCFVLFLITLVGHGIWLVLAALARAVSAPEPRSSRQAGGAPGQEVPCPRCDRPVTTFNEQCPRCGLAEPVERGKQLQNLDIARRVLLKLTLEEELDDETVTRLTGLLARRRLAILRPEPVEEPRAVRAEVVRVAPHYGPPPPPPRPVQEEILTAVAAEEEEAVRPAEALPADVSPAPVATPHRPLTDLLVGFMAERNILWGELVGGLLIVGCSIALVLTLWNSLQELPYFPFLLFSTITAALFGGGLYTLHHWKLEATSRGLLVIALLLAPLNLLVLADPSARGGVAATGWLHPLVVGLSLLLFGWMVWASGRDLIGAHLLPGPVDRRWLLALAIVGATASAFFTPGLLSGIDPGRALLTGLVLGALPAACYLLTTGAVLAGLTLYRPRDRELTATQAHALFTFLGLALFALVASLAFLQSRSPRWLDHLSALALPLALAGVPGLVGGLLVHRRLANAEDAATRTAGTGVTLAGLTLMLAGLGLGWPHPLPLLVVACINAATLTFAAFRGRVRFLHVGSIPCLALALLLAVQIVMGGAEVIGSISGLGLAARLGSASGGLTLALFVAAITGLAVWLDRRQEKDHALAYAVGAIGLGVVALFIATAHGPSTPFFAAGIYGLVALTALAACLHVPRHGLAQPGAWLLLPASLWALEAWLPGAHLTWGLVLATEGVVLHLTAGFVADRQSPFRVAFQSAGVAAGLLALGMTFYRLPWPMELLSAVTLCLVTAQLFLLAWQTRQPVLSDIGSYFGLAALFVFVLQMPPAGLHRQVVLVLLGHATLASVVAWGIGRWGEEIRRVFADPLGRSAAATSLAAVPFFLWPGEALSWRAGFALWAAILWLERAWRARSPGWFTLTQAGVSVAVLFAVRAVVERQGWFGEPLGLFDPRMGQLVGMALGLLGLVWVGLRRVELLRPLWPSDANSLERIMTGLIVVGQLLLVGLYVGPGAAAEWFPGFSLAEVPWWTPDAFGGPGWLCLATLTALLVAGLHGPSWRREETFRIGSLAGLIVLAVSDILLWAGPFAEERATASALRWGLSALFLIGSVLLWYRDRLAQVAWTFGFAVGTSPPGEDPIRAQRIDLVVRGLVSLVGVAVFCLSAMVAQLGFAGLTLGGPEADSVFAHLGFTLSNVGPLVLLVVGLAGSGLRERSATYAFLACLLATLTSTAGLALSVPAVGLREFLLIWLVGVQTASAGALCWLLAGARLPAGRLLAFQSRVGLGALALLGLAPLCGWLIDPEWPIGMAFHVLGRIPGWLALALAFLASFLHARRHEPARQIDSLGVTSLLAGVLVGCLALPWDGPGLWMAFGVLTVSWGYLGALVVLVGFFTRPFGIGWPMGFAPGGVSRWLTGVGALLCLLALRCADGPWRPWLPVGAALVASAVFAAPALWFRRGAFSYASGLAIVLAGWLMHVALADQTVPAFLLAVSLSLAIASALWSIPDVRDRIPFSSLASPLAVGLVACAVAGTLMADLADMPAFLQSWLAWITLVAVAVAFYFERDTPVAGPGVYALLLTAMGLLLHTLPIGRAQLPWALGLGFAVHFGLTAAIARANKDKTERESFWFFPVQFLVGGLVVVLAVWSCLVPDRLGERLTGPLMLLLLAPGGWLLAGATPSLSIYRLRWLAPAAVMTAIVSIAWAVPTGFGPGVWLERNAWLLFLLAMSAIAYLESAPWPRPVFDTESGWPGFREAARRVGHFGFALALGMVPFVMVEMMPLFDPQTRRTSLSLPAIVAFFIGVAGLMVTSLRFALLTGREPLGLSERGRQWYVYLAEGLLVVLFMHLRLNVPELFRGGLVKYWPLFVMLIAYAGVGLSELFERRGLAVLAEPLQRTGIFLPVVPLLAFWARPPAGVVEMARTHAPGMVPFLENLSKLPWDFHMHALIWFLAGGVYLLLALSRQSTGWALLSALAANCALWALWVPLKIAFFSHPQVWILPLGLILLVAEHLERARLGPERAAALRYLGVCLIYVASTAELFIAGLGNSLWLPVILAVLCVAGVLAGIWLRVKAFLFVGVSFLILDIVTMIWHAAVNRAHTWVWWASGIVLGMAILALFAVFEKRRNDVLRLLDDLRRWD